MALYYPVMSPYQNEYVDDPLFYGYRECVRALLRDLILVQGVSPSSPLVASYDHYLHLGTAYSEFLQIIERGGMEAALHHYHWFRVCFRGCDLYSRHNYSTATSLADQEENENFQEMEDNINTKLIERE